jgi:hypothetical protein
VTTPQPSGPSALTLTFPNSELDTITLVVAVQPLLFVNTTEYVPAAVAEITDVLAPVDHKTNPVPMADKLTVGLAQLMTVVLALMLSEGAAVELTTTALATAVQPLLPVKVTE